MSRILQTKDVYITQQFSGKHKGLDVVGLNGSAHVTDGITAHTAGRVVAMAVGHGNNKGASGTDSYGNYVKLEHPGGWYTLYAHLRDVDVTMGQQVDQGQRIGYMGNTGNSYGAHLHWEVRTPDNQRVDPEPYLDADLPGAADDAEPAPEVTYQAYASGKWWGRITGYNDRDTGGYAGIKGKAMSGLYAEATEGVLRLRAHQMEGDRWLPWVENWEDYAGNLGKGIDLIQAELVECPGYAVEYRVSNPGRGYWAWIRQCDNEKPTLRYAGVPGKPIDRVQMRIAGPGPQPG